MVVLTPSWQLQKQIPQMLSLAWVAAGLWLVQVDQMVPQLLRSCHGWDLLLQDSDSLK